MRTLIPVCGRNCYHHWSVNPAFFSFVIHQIYDCPRVAKMLNGWWFTSWVWGNDGCWRRHQPWPRSRLVRYRLSKYTRRRNREPRGPFTWIPVLPSPTTLWWRQTLKPSDVANRLTFPWSRLALSRISHGRKKESNFLDFKMGGTCQLSAHIKFGGTG